MLDTDDDGRFVTIFRGEDMSEETQGENELNLTTYRHPGPVAEAFFFDDSFISFIQGPYGSAKTTTCFFKLIRRALEMPVCKDGVRRYRALVLRDTYRRMERSALRSWFKWFPKSVGQFTGGQDRPSRHILMVEDLRGVPTEIDVEFAAVGDNDIEDFAGGYEVTDVYLNEANLLSGDVLTYFSGRVGRYPAQKDLPHGTVYRAGVFGDLNAPEPDSWLMKLKFGDLDETQKHLGEMSFFLQPGGRDPGAENIHNLNGGADYYMRLAAANAHQPWWVARMIDNKSGYSRHGKPVYEVYRDAVHATREPLPLDKSLPLLFGFDAGLHPAGVVGQQRPDGQVRIVKEFLPGHMGPTRFGELLRLWLDTEAAGCKIGSGWVDPTAYNGADQAGGELNWVQIVEAKTGIRMRPGPSNEPGIRQDAVSQLLVLLIDGEHPALLVSSHCVELRKGFASHYRFVKVKSDLGDGYAYTPQKNDYSHVHDALQYLLLGLRGKPAVIGNKVGSRLITPATPAIVAETGFNVFG